MDLLSPDQPPPTCKEAFTHAFDKLNQWMRGGPTIPAADDLLKNSIPHHHISAKNFTLKYKHSEKYYDLTTFNTTIQAAGVIVVHLRQENENEVLKSYVKFSPETRLYPGLVKELDLLQRFGKEIHFYNEVVPQLIDFQIPFYNLSQNEKAMVKYLFPPCYGARYSINREATFPDKDATVVLRNETQFHFYQIDPHTKMDFDSAKAFVKGMATFHATTLCFKKRYPDRYYEVFGPCLEVYSRQHSYCAVHSEVLYVEERLEIYKEFKDDLRLKKMVKDALAYSKINMANPPIDDNWIGFCHGGFDLYNLMILKKGVDSIRHIRLLDYQNTMHRHILTDLAYFLMTSSPRGFFKQHYEELTKLYHKSFVALVNIYQVDPRPYNYEAFMSELTESFRKELLKGIQHLKFTSAKVEERDAMRTLASFPKYTVANIDSRVNPVFYREQLTSCIMNLLDVGIIVEQTTPRIQGVGICTCRVPSVEDHQVASGFQASPDDEVGLADEAVGGISAAEVEAVRAQEDEEGAMVVENVVVEVHQEPAGSATADIAGVEGDQMAQEMQSAQSDQGSQDIQVVQADQMAQEMQSAQSDQGSQDIQVVQADQMAQEMQSAQSDQGSQDIQVEEVAQAEPAI